MLWNIPRICPSHDLKFQERKWNSGKIRGIGGWERSGYQKGSMIMARGASYTDVPPSTGDRLGSQPSIFDAYQTLHRVGKYSP